MNSLPGVGAEEAEKEKELHHLQKNGKERLHHCTKGRGRKRGGGEEEQPSEAFQASEVDMVEPLSGRELLVKEQVIFTQRRTKAKVLHFVFQYLKPWGPARMWQPGPFSNGLGGH